MEEQECYYIEGIFFTDPIVFLQDEIKNFDKVDILSYPEDYVLKAYVCKREYMQFVDADTFIWAIDEERFDEDRSQEDKLREIFNKYIDFESINRNMPKLWYPTKEIKIWTKVDLLGKIT